MTDSNPERCSWSTPSGRLAVFRSDGQAELRIDGLELGRFPSTAGAVEVGAWLAANPSALVAARADLEAAELAEGGDKPGPAIVLAGYDADDLRRVLGALLEELGDDHEGEAGRSFSILADLDADLGIPRRRSLADLEELAASDPDLLRVLGFAKVDDRPALPPE